MAGWTAAELEWGHGPRVFEMFLEPTCPFSNKAFGKIKDLLAAAGEDKITVKVRLQSQPWHLYSGVIVRAILAASTLENGRDAAWKVMEAVAAHRDEFEFDKHCTGPNRTASSAIGGANSAMMTEFSGGWSLSQRAIPKTAAVPEALSSAPW